MTSQEAFDTALAHLREQGAICRGDDGCLYRGPDGRKCAIGALIPDDMVEFDRDTRHGKANGLPVRDLMAVFPAVYRLFEAVRPSILEALQTLHDSESNWDDAVGFIGESEAAGIAESWGLHFEPPGYGDFTD
jgi:hypothetical protein